MFFAVLETPEVSDNSSATQHLFSPKPGTVCLQGNIGYYARSPPKWKDSWRLPNMPENSTSQLKVMKHILQISSLCGLLFLSACNGVSSLDFPGVYKIGIPQGNVITQDMVDQLRPGMTKRQVIFIMGTPLVRDPYHQDRWDYIYSYQPGGGVRGQEKVSIFFVNDEMVRFTGDFVPSTAQTDSADDSDD